MQRSQTMLLQYLGFPTARVSPTSSMPLPIPQAGLHSTPMPVPRAGLHSTPLPIPQAGLHSMPYSTPQVPTQAEVAQFQTFHDLLGGRWMQSQQRPHILQDNGQAYRRATTSTNVSGDPLANQQEDGNENDGGDNAYIPDF